MRTTTLAINPEASVSPAALSERVASALSDPSSARVLKDDTRSRVVLVEAEGRRWVAKWMRLPRWKAVLFAMLRVTPGWKIWRGSQRLGALPGAGLRVSRPAALLGLGPLSRDGQVLVLPYVEGATLDQLLREQGPPQSWDPPTRELRLRLARGMGGQIARIAAAGLTFRDYKPTNLIVDEQARQTGQPVIIDVDGLRHRVNRRKVVRMGAVLLRAAQRVGHVTEQEMRACAEAVVEIDPRWGAAEALLREVLAATDARPLSYDPATGRSLRS